MVIDVRYPNLDYEDLLPAMSEEEQKAMMARSSNKLKSKSVNIG